MSLFDHHERQEDKARAQAAQWLARLHSGERTQEDVEAFQAWLGENEVHQTAFDAVTTSWDLAGGLKDIPRQKVGGQTRRAMLASACAIGVSGVAGVRWAMAERPATYASDIGEIRRVTLADGSRLVLDTASRVDVAFAKSRRMLTLVNGRAHVEVAKDASRPFSVEADDHQVIARGTVFEVALAGGDMQVLLTEGLVDVVSKSGDRAALVPGQRLSYSGGGIRIDEPDASRLLAWQSGRLIFDNDRLEDAVGEMNRYDRRKIILPDTAVRNYRISGTYETGNTLHFAQSVGQLLDVRITEQGDDIALYPDPSRSETAT